MPAFNYDANRTPVGRIENKDRSRWYGIRPGDKVVQTFGGTEMRGTVKALHGMDNNGCTLQVRRGRALVEVKAVCEWCTVEYAPQGDHPAYFLLTDTLDRWEPEDTVFIVENTRPTGIEMLLSVHEPSGKYRSLRGSPAMQDRMREFARAKGRDTKNGMLGATLVNLGPKLGWGVRDGGQ